MTTPTLFKYIWLVNTINQARNITLNDINKKWLKTEMGGGVELARSTFNRHKVALSTLSVNNIISESLSLYSRILLESIPSTDEGLEKIKHTDFSETGCQGVRTPMCRASAPFLEGVKGDRRVTGVGAHIDV